MIFDLAEMVGADDRSDARVRIQGIADFHGLGTINEFGKKRLCDLGVQQQARTRIATLACVEVYAQGRGVERGVNVGIGENNLRIFAAKLHRHLLEGRCPRSHRGPADRSRTREGNHIDIGVRRHRCSDLRAVASHDVADAVPQAGFGQQRPEMQRRRRSHLARFYDACAARREREGKLLRDDQKRKIPRRDDRHDADRLAPDHAQPIGSEVGVALARE